MDNNAAMMGDWVPPSPSSKLFFSSFLEGDEPMNSEPLPQSPDKAKQSGISYENDATLNQLSDVKKRGGLGDRIAARAGFSAPRLNTESIRSSDGSSNNDAKSPYIITIPPGISPTALLESPVFLSHSLTQASPTTGKFPFFPGGNLRGTAMVSSGQSREDFFDDVDGSSFEFKPHLDPGFPFSLGTRAIPSIDVTVRSETNLQNFIPSQVQSHSEFPQPLRGKDETKGTPGTETRCFDTVSGTAEHSPPLSDQQDDDDDGEEQGRDDTLGGGAAAGVEVEDDGYNWRKYGQKQVKGSEFPRSYFKCTHMTCPVKKKVEKSREGHLTEIIYTGEHNHPKPTLNRRTSTGSNQFEDTDGPDNGGENRPVWGAGLNGHPQWNENSNSLMSMNSELRRSSSPALHIQNGAFAESGEAVDPSSTFSNDGEDVSATVGSASIANDIEGDESESKRRKIETYAAEIGSGATRAIREPRVVVQTASDVDILDDGYRWRKYGQKVVKGNPNPRSYYKCTSVGCTVRKHVERASHDFKSVITTYEGKHNHDVPPARNSSHVNSTTSAAFASHPQNLPQVSNMGRYERAPHLNMFNMPMMQQQQQQAFVPLPMGLNQAGLTNLSMAGLGPRQNKYQGMPVHPYIMQQQQMQQQKQLLQVNDMGLTMPKGDVKVEPNADPNICLSNGSSVYHQIMNRLPLGP